MQSNALHGPPAEPADAPSAPTTTLPQPPDDAQTLVHGCCACDDLPSVRDLHPLTAATAPGATTARTPTKGPMGVLDAVARLGLHVAVASLPILAIAAHVLGVFPIRIAAGLAVVPLTGLAGFLAVFAPHPLDRIVGRGMVWGVIACGFYDFFRLDTVYLLGYWGDFIPRVGSWVTGQSPSSDDSILTGYVWRYLGDGGGIGIVFFLGAALLGLEGWRRWHVLALAIGFAIFPVWAGLIGTVLLSSGGHAMLFRLSMRTIELSFVGHVIFGLCLGLGLWRAHCANREMFRSVITVPRGIRRRR